MGVNYTQSTIKPYALFLKKNVLEKGPFLSIPSLMPNFKRENSLGHLGALLGQEFETYVWKDKMADGNTSGHSQLVV